MGSDDAGRPGVVVEHPAQVADRGVEPLVVVDVGVAPQTACQLGALHQVTPRCDQPAQQAQGLIADVDDLAVTREPAQRAVELEALEPQRAAGAVAYCPLVSHLPGFDSTPPWAFRKLHAHFIARDVARRYP